MSSRSQNSLDSMVRAHQARATDEQTLHYAPRDFVLIGMPYRRPKDSAVFERRNGNFRFRIVSPPDIGLPYGQDRLLPFWLASAYHVQGCPESRTIVFRAAADILRCYGIEPHGSQHQRLRERLERVFAATFFADDRTPGAGLSPDIRHRVREPNMTPAASFKRIQRYQLIDQMSLWIQQSTQVNQYTLWQNTITLSEQFARDVRECAVPVDLETIRALRTRPLALDLYVWQSWRSWRLASMKREVVRIPLRGESGLLVQLGIQVKRERKGIEEIRNAQSIIKATWTECRNTIENDLFLLRPCRAVREGRTMIMPGVNNPPRHAADGVPTSRRIGAGELVMLRKDERSGQTDEDRPS